MPMDDNELRKCDSQRDIGAELLEAVRQIKEGNGTSTTPLPASLTQEARQRAGLSRARFATALGVCQETLKDWEKNRRQPAGAALTLIKIAAVRPEVLCEALGFAETPRHE